MASHKEDPSKHDEQQSYAEKLRKAREGKRKRTIPDWQRSSPESDDGYILIDPHASAASASFSGLSGLQSVPSSSSSSDDGEINAIAMAHLSQASHLYSLDLDESERKTHIAEHYDYAWQMKPTDIGILAEILGYYTLKRDETKQQEVLDRIVNVLSPERNPAELFDKANNLHRSLPYVSRIVNACYEGALEMHVQDMRLLDHIIGYFIEKNQFPQAKRALDQREVLALGEVSDASTDETHDAVRKLIIQGQQRLFGEESAELALAHFRGALELKPRDTVLLYDIAQHFILYHEIKVEDVLNQGFDYLPPAQKALLLIKIAKKMPAVKCENKGEICEAAFHLGQESLMVLDKVLSYHLERGEQDKAEAVAHYIVNSFPRVQDTGYAPKNSEQLEFMARMLPDYLVNKEYIKYAYYERVLELKPYNASVLRRAAAFFEKHADFGAHDTPTAAQKKDMQYAVGAEERLINIASDAQSKLHGYVNKANYLRLAENYEQAKKVAETAEAYMASAGDIFSPRSVSMIHLVKGHIFFDQALKHTVDVPLEDLTGEQRVLMQQALDCYTMSWKADPTYANAYKAVAAAHHNLWQEDFSKVAGVVQELLDPELTVDGILKKANSAQYFPVRRFACSLILDSDPIHERAFLESVACLGKTSLHTCRRGRVSTTWDKWSYGRDLDDNPVDEIAFKSYCEVANPEEIAGRTLNALLHNPAFEPAQVQLAQLRRIIPALNVRAWRALAVNPSFAPALEFLDMIDHVAFSSTVPVQRLEASSLTSLCLPAQCSDDGIIVEAERSRVPSLSEMILRVVFKDKGLHQILKKGEQPYMTASLRAVVKQQEGKQWRLYIENALEARAKEQQEAAL